MDVSETGYILEAIEGNIGVAPEAEYLPHNKWLLSSAMQKSIRRRNTEQAVQSAINLHHVDKRMLWRRLPIIALEDVGLGDVGAVSETLAISASTVWRNRIGDLNAAVYAVRRLSEAIKNRTCTDAYIVADKWSGCLSQRQALSGMEENELVDVLRDKHQPITMRVLALWLIAGTDRYPSDHLPEREGDLSLAVELMKEMNAPVPIIQTCIQHLKKSMYPLALLTPLMFDAFGNCGGEEVENAIPEAECVNDLPLYALDGLYTRDGKACVRQWQKVSPALKPFSVQSIALALFWVEGAVLDREWQCPPFQELYELSKRADFEEVGCSEQQQSEIIHAVKREMPLLMEIRKAYLSENKQNDLFGYKS